MHKAKILIIEDEEVLVQVISAKLNKVGYSVEIAVNGEEGLKKINDYQPDLILLDIVMPKVNGYEVLEQMQKEGIKIPVIIISNSGQAVEIEKAETLGAVDFLVKANFSPEEVLTKVKNYLTQALNAGQLESKTEKKSEIKPEINKEVQQLGVKIFLVEDDSFLSDICGKKLINEGYSVYTAVDGKEAVNGIAQAKPDLVLLDIILPSMDGFQVLSAIRLNQDEKVSNVPIIMLSNLGQEEDVKKAMDAGANDYLIKAHFTTEDIINKIKEILAK
ncbi:MAG: response regulator [Patescibacteria group bacterium]|nr:response regulator [Patescibacteria group bacterium]